MKYSIVIPFYNEEQTVPHLFKRLLPVCKKLKDYEILCIDDGSRDRTLDFLKIEKNREEKIKIIKFEKNAGQSDAFAAGFEIATGDLVITMDGDLQNPPEEVFKLLKEIPCYDLVVGWRYKRQDSIAKKNVSRLANNLRNIILNSDVHDTGCSLKVFKKEVIKKIKLYKGMHRFFPAIANIGGFSVKEVKVDHEDRKWGKTKYGTFKRVIPAFFDLLAVIWMKKRRLTYKIDKIIE